VYDVVQALWHVASHGESGEIYNLADKNDTSKEKIKKNLFCFNCVLLFMNKSLVIFQIRRKSMRC
jgi:dTDP-D-glucose 4,6-dehydratase